METEMEMSQEAKTIFETAISRAQVFTKLYPDHPAAPTVSAFLRTDFPMLSRLELLLLRLWEAYLTSRTLDSLNKAIVIGSEVHRFFDSSTFTPCTLSLLTKGIATHKPDWLIVPHILSLAFQLRFDLTGQPGDLDKAISLRKETLSTRLDGDVARVQDEAILCKLLCAKFNRFMPTDIGVITEAISCGRSALRAVRSDQKKYAEHLPTHLPTLLSNLACALSARSQHFDIAEDTKDSIALMRDALVAAEEAQHPPQTLALMYSNLGAVLQGYVRRGLEASAAAAAECVERLSQGVELTPVDSPLRPLRENNLACAFTTKFYILRELTDLDRAIDTARAALDSLSKIPTHLRVSLMDLLSLCYYLRFDKTQAVNNLDQSIDISRRVIATSSDFGSAIGDLTSSHARLALAHLRRFKKQSNPRDLEEAMSIYARIKPSIKSFHLRFFMICAFANQSVLQRRMEDIVEDFREALDLLPRVLLLGKDYRLNVLAKADGTPGESVASGLALNGAARSIACGKPGVAIELLEQGRSIAWTRNFQMRGNFDRLAADYPDHARRLSALARIQEEAEEIQIHVEESTQSIDSQRLHPSPWEQSFTSSQQWYELLAEIRTLDGYHDFLLPLQYKELRYAASKGPVVVVNVSNYRCDALIMADSTFDRPQVVPLSRKLWNLTRQWYDELSHGVKDLECGRMPESVFNKVLKRVLRGLWREVVSPVSEALRSLTPYARRVWWCPTGRLTFLPLHMAAESNNGPPFISSYAITVTSLLRAQTVSRDTQAVNILAVSSANVPGYTVLPNTLKEIQTLQELLPEGTVTHLGKTEARMDRVLSGLTNHPWVHFACHGAQQEKPYRSHFVLSDGPLHMSDIIARTLPNAEFAFLSACETAAGIPDLYDEAMHLAAGLSFVGYRSIVATMWAMKDDVAPKLIKRVYGHLFRNPGLPPNVEDAAEALHNAVQELRNDGVPLSRLAPFIHIGV